MTMHASERAPGPGFRQLFTTMRAIQRDRLAFLREMTGRFGDLVLFHMGPRTVFLVSSPELARHVLKTNEQNYRKGMGLRDANPLLGEGLLTSEGETWHQQHRQIQPLFGPQTIASYLGVMAEESDDMVARWSASFAPETTVDLAAELTRLTLRILGRTLFGADLGEVTDVIGQGLTVVMQQAMARMIFPFTAYLPTPANFRLRAAVHEMDRLVYRLIEERRARPSGQDLLSLLIAGAPEAAEPGRGRQLRDEVMTLLVAGHETTASWLGWTFVLLAGHPEVRARLEAEVDGVLGAGAVTLERLGELRFARMVLEESSRLFPPVWMLPREAIAEDRLDRYRVPAGAGVLVSPYTIHRHPAHWAHPERFDPERFAPGRVAERAAFAYLPFGAGPRQCIGRHFGMMEAQCVLATVAQRYRLELCHGPVVADPLLTLRPRGGLPMRALPRRATA
jgi:cytochrome P450